MKKILNKNHTMTRIETKLGGEIEEILRNLFVDERLSQKEIAQKLEISYLTTIRWLKRAGVYSRRINL